MSQHPPLHDGDTFKIGTGNSPIYAEYVAKGSIHDHAWRITNSVGQGVIIEGSEQIRELVGVLGRSLVSGDVTEAKEGVSVGVGGIVAPCMCGKPYKAFEACPFCGERICIDCEDWEAYHGA